MSRPFLFGTCTALVACAFFAFIALNISEGGPFASIDKKFALDMKVASSRQPIFRQVMILVTRSGGFAGMALVAAVGVVWQRWRGHGKMRVAFGWALIVIGGALLNVAAKAVVNRERPPIAWRDPAAMETNESFPSGHAMGSTIGIGFLGYALMLRDRHWRTKLAIVLVLGAWVLSVGFSRVYLRAHWFSDVLGGFALGLAWLSLGLGLLETWRRHGHVIRETSGR